MKSLHRILCSAIVLACGVLNLVGCGQTGALYLPAPTKPAGASMAPSTPLPPPST